LEEIGKAKQILDEEPKGTGTLGRPRRTGKVSITITSLYIYMGHAVAKLIEALCYKPEGRWFESRMRWIFFNLPNPSSRIMALESTQPLTEMSTRNFPGGKKRPERKADNLAAIYKPNV
jgi:hypothetical protein